MPCAPDQIDAKYIAHIRRRVRTLDDPKRIEAEPFDAFLVRSASVAVYHLGNSGAACTQPKLGRSTATGQAQPYVIGGDAVGMHRFEPARVLEPPRTLCAIAPTSANRGVGFLRDVCAPVSQLLSHWLGPVHLLPDQLITDVPDELHDLV